MRLLYLKLTNFRPFTEAELDLNADGLIGIRGPNGAGKSSLLAAVEWALYGQKRGAGSIPARRTGAAKGEKLQVELQFSSDGHNYKVVRSETNARLWFDGELLAEGLTHTAQAAVAALGVSRDSFTSTFYARQREIQALNPQGDAAKRRRQLEDLLGLTRLRLQKTLTYDATVTDGRDNDWTYVFEPRRDADLQRHLQRGETFAPADTGQAAAAGATSAADAESTAESDGQDDRALSSVSSPRLSPRQRVNARIVYALGLKAPVARSRARELVAAAFRESGLDARAVNSSSGAAGLFQLLSSGYVNRAKKLGGVFNPRANTCAILPDYVAYWRRNPAAQPGAAAAGVERSGQSAAWYAEPLSWLPKSFVKVAVNKCPL